MNMRKRTIILISIGAFILVLAATTLIAASSVFDKIVANPNHKPSDMISLFSGIQKVERHLREAAKEPAGRVSELSLTEAEANAMADSLLANPFILSLTGSQPVPNSLMKLHLHLQKGIFSVLYTYDTGFNSPFGRYINLKCTARLAVKEGKPEVEVLSCRAGSLPVPASFATAAVQNTLRKKYYGRPYENIVKDGVVSLMAENGALTLKYRPKELIDTADTVIYGSTDNKIRHFLSSYTKKR